jgi:hypothetical protein
MFRLIIVIMCVVSIRAHAVSTQDVEMTIDQVSLESPSVNDGDYTALSLSGTLTKCSPVLPESSYDPDYNGCPRSPNQSISNIKILFKTTGVVSNPLFEFCRTNALLAENDEDKTFTLRLIFEDEPSPHYNIGYLYGNRALILNTGDTFTFLVKDDDSEYLNIACGIK